MKRIGLGLCIAVSTAFSAAMDASASPPARTLDSRLVFELIAAEPEIVTPTGIAVDQHGRVLVVESHTHFRPVNYQGPPADRIRVFEDRNGDGKPECTGTFFEGTQKTMNVAVARDGSVFVATRSALYRLEDRDGDGRADGADGGTASHADRQAGHEGRLSRTTACPASHSTMRARSTSAWAKTWVLTTG